MLVDSSPKLTNRMVLQAGIQLIGAFLALIFPFLATFTELSNSNSQINLASFIAAQSNQQILWLIDGIALILASFFIWSAVQVIRRIQLIEDFKERITQRTAELYTLKEISQREILERHQAESNISRAKKEWEATFDAISDLTLLTDHNGKIIRCNKATVKKLETSFKAIIGRNIEEVFPGVIEPAQGKTTSKTQVLSLPSSIGWFEVSGFPYQGVENQQGVIYILHDVTQRKRAEAEIQRQKQFFEGVFQNSPVAIVSLDLNGSIVACNPAFEEMFGFSQVQVIGRKVDDLITPVDQREQSQEFYRRAKSGEVIHYVGHRLTLFDSQIDVEIFNVPVTVNGEELGVLCLYHDITELVKARRKAEDADLAKTEFLANLSHEIRTPLNGIIGMLNLALASNPSLEQSEYLTTSLDSADTLLSLLNDSLDLAKIEAGKMDLEIVDFNLREIIESSLSGQAQRAAIKGLELTSYIPSDIPILLKGDPNRLRQILNNLVGNAVKFTEKGEVVVQVKKIAEEGPKINLGFYVKDTGIGIPHERQTVIFDRFTQGSSYTTRKYGGTGLGLSISAQLVNLLGGKISLSSQEGVGSIFSFNLPFIKQPHDETGPLELLRLMHGIRILIVDSNENSYLSLKSILEGLGAQAVSALDENQCIIQLDQAHKVGKSYQLIFIDSKIAYGENLNFIKKLQSKEIHQNIPVILMTTMEQRFSRNATEDYAGFILKPVRVQTLQSTLKSILSSSKDISEIASKQKIVTSELDKKTSHPGNILLVEDNPINRKVVINLLKRYGHSVATAENGRQALEILSQNHIDLILMDVQLPEMDGYETTQHIRASEDNNRAIPIIAMTAHVLTGDIEQCFSSGMDDYIPKPVKPQVLFKKIEQWLAPVSPNGSTNSKGEPPLQDPKNGKNIISNTTKAEKIVDSPDNLNNDELQFPDNDFEAFSQSMEDFTQSEDNLIANHKNLSSGGENTSHKPRQGFSSNLSFDKGMEEAKSTYKPARSLGDSSYLETILPRFGNDMPFFLATFREFIEQTKKKAKQLREAFDARNLNNINLLLHNLQGVSANFEANRLYAITYELEKQVEKGDLTHASDLISEIEKHIPFMEKLLKQYQTMQKPEN